MSGSMGVFAPPSTRDSPASDAGARLPDWKERRDRPLRGMDDLGGSSLDLSEGRLSQGGCGDDDAVPA
jgi:hypothetical protein